MRDRWLALRSKTFLGVFLVCAASNSVTPRESRASEPIERVLPPAGIAIADDARASLDGETRRLKERLQRHTRNPLFADCQVYVKALELALHYGEFYGPKDVAKATFLIKEAERRLERLDQDSADWSGQRGLTVRGYLSRLDGSAQPYGVVTAADHDFARPAPLYVWLHGRGDKQTDLHFIHERHHSVGQIAPPGAIVIHPFGRHCLGFKSAGEIDVLEAVEHAKSQYKIDPDRIVLSGFSMGGAGAWHLGAHYADRWCAVSPGAGFAETARYNRIAPEKFPPSYEQTLWGCYDVPNYVRNLFNVPVIAYSGEQDKQIQAAQVMEEAYRQEGRTLRHLIGPGVEHRYHPDTLQQLLAELATIVQQGRAPHPRTVSLQTRTLRYSRQYWVEALELGRHWQDSRIDAHLEDGESLDIKTLNIASFRVTPPGAVTRLTVDGQTVTLAGGRVTAFRPLELSRPENGPWKFATAASATQDASRLLKRPGLQGPIDDAFLEPFLVVTPSGSSANTDVERWVQAELAHFLDRWLAVCRGTLITKTDAEVTPADIADKHLVLWGDASSNRLIAALQQRLPIRWSAEQVVLADRQWSASHHVPALIYPNPLNPKRYVVVNSGLTFREAHDRTNSQQNPKLPDWAIIDIRQPANAQSPGRIADAGFWNEEWK